MKLKELLLKVYEGKCERLPNESDEEYLTRCGNDMFNQKGKDVCWQNIGTFTRPVVKEGDTTFGPGEVPVMVKLVFWDDKKGLKDPKKVKEILRVLERNLNIKKYAFKGINTSEVMSGFKYYPGTDKLIGNYPKHLFLPSNKPRYTISMKHCTFNHELEKVSPSLEVKEK